MRRYTRRELMIFNQTTVAKTWFLKLSLFREGYGITKTLTMHIARNTFASMSGDKIPIQLLQKLYRHSDITTTINYQSSFINKDLNDALDKVTGY